MANKLHTSGGKIRKMYMMYGGEMRQVKYAYYEGDKVYACFEPPIVVGIKITYSYKKLKTTNYEAEEGNTYVIASASGNTFTVTLPPYECSITGMLISWTQVGPDTEDAATDAGSRGNYYDITDVSSIPDRAKEEGDPEYVNGWTLPLNTFDNLQKSNIENTGIQESFKVKINDETSENSSTIIFKRQKNVIVIDKKYDSTIQSPRLSHSDNEYKAHTISLYNNSSDINTVTEHQEEYTSTYQDEDKIENPTVSTYQVSTNGTSWSDTGTSYEVTTSTYKDENASRHTYYFRGVVEAFGKTFYSPTTSFTQVPDKLTKDIRRPSSGYNIQTTKDVGVFTSIYLDGNGASADMTEFLKDRYTETKEQFYYMEDVWDSGDTENSTRIVESSEVIDTQDCTLGGIVYGSGVSVEGNIITITKEEEKLDTTYKNIADVSFGYGDTKGSVWVYAKKKSTS